MNEEIMRELFAGDNVSCDKWYWRKIRQGRGLQGVGALPEVTFCVKL